MLRTLTGWRRFQWSSREERERRYGMPLIPQERRDSSTLNRIASWSEHPEKERPMHFILFVLIGLVAGALAGRVVSGHGYGLIGDLIVGVVGAFLGGWLFAVAFGVVGGGFVASLLTAFVGAVILLWLIRLFAPSRA